MNQKKLITEYVKKKNRGKQLRDNQKRKTKSKLRTYNLTTVGISLLVRTYNMDPPGTSHLVRTYNMTL